MDNTKIRIDKWLWAARFFKTRNLATEAINGGKVHLNQQRIKPSKSVKVGDILTIRKFHTEFTVIVQGLSSRRGPAPEAQLLYTETLDSIEQRQRSAEERQKNVTRPRGSGRPTKKDRRAINRFIRRQ